MATQEIQHDLGNTNLLEGLRAHLQPLAGDARQYDGLLALIGQARFALLGEASHGTHDGAEGCRRIKAAGGTTFAQDASAEVSGMPLSAQATGCIDFVLSPDKIPAELDKLITRFERGSPKGFTTPKKR